MRHPNYLAVIVEIACVPLIRGCWLTAVVFSIGNAILLWVRIRAEEAAMGPRYALRNRRTACGCCRSFAAAGRARIRRQRPPHHRLRRPDGALMKEGPFTTGPYGKESRSTTVGTESVFLLSGPLTTQLCCSGVSSF